MSQHQGSVTDQLQELMELAGRAELYDAQDWVRTRLDELSNQTSTIPDIHAAYDERGIALEKARGEIAVLAAQAAAQSAAIKRALLFIDQMKPSGEVAPESRLIISGFESMRDQLHAALASDAGRALVEELAAAKANVEEYAKQWREIGLKLQAMKHERDRLARTVDRKDEQMAELQEALDKARADVVMHSERRTWEYEQADKEARELRQRVEAAEQERDLLHQDRDSWRKIAEGQDRRVAELIAMVRARADSFHENPIGVYFDKLADETEAASPVTTNISTHKLCEASPAAVSDPLLESERKQGRDPLKPWPNDGPATVNADGCPGPWNAACNASSATATKCPACNGCGMSHEGGKCGPIACLKCHGERYVSLDSHKEKP